MNFIVINKNSDNFKEMCDKCEKEIVLDNLRKNGGTLNYSNLTYESNLLVLCILDNEPIGFCSLVKVDIPALYVYQIAVQKEYQRKGIGTELLEKAKEIANEFALDLSAHIKSYNIGSQKTFEKCGFKKSKRYSNEDEYYYRYSYFINKMSNDEKGLN